MSPQQQVRLLIVGRVQGVCFRASTLQKANELGVFGYVRNLTDGNVEAVAEGNAEQLKQFVAWARKGPPAARVDEVQVTESVATSEFSAFSVIE